MRSPYRWMKESLESPVKGYYYILKPIPVMTLAKAKQLAKSWRSSKITDYKAKVILYQGGHTVIIKAGRGYKVPTK